MRQHVEETFGIKAYGGNPPPPPTQDQQVVILRSIAAGGTLQKPFLYDWCSHPTTDYNVCIEEAFCTDFWANVAGGTYALRDIPPRYQSQKGFIGVLRTHLAGRRQKWLKARRTPPTAAQRIATAKHNTRNSRVATVCLLTLTPRSPQ